MDQIKPLKAPVIALAVFAVLCLGFLAGIAYAGNDGSEHRSMLARLRAELAGNKVDGGRLINKALETLRDEYFVEVTPELQQDLVYSAVQGMLAVLRKAPYNDDFTVFYDPDLYQELQTETTGDYAGIGILMTTTPDGQYPEVVNVFEGSGAKDAAVEEGDIIAEIDGEMAHEMPLPEVATKIKGPPGTRVKLKLYRPSTSATLDLEVERRDVHYSSITKKELRPGKVGYVRISNFAEDTGPDFRKAMDELSAEGMSSLIIDLRENPGGLVEAARDVADCFVKEGLIVGVETRSKAGVQRPLMADPTSKKYELPVLVMVNDYSASASEILTSVLRDYGIAKVIGEKTFGKGVVQAVVPLETVQQEVLDPSGKTRVEQIPRSALAVVIGKYFTPKHEEIHGKGLTPDYFYNYENFVADDPVLKGYQVDLERLQKDVAALRAKATRHLRSNDIAKSKAEEVARLLASGAAVPTMPQIQPKEEPGALLGMSVSGPESPRHESGADGSEPQESQPKTGK